MRSEWSYWIVDFECDMRRGGLCEGERRLKREGKDPEKGGKISVVSHTSKYHCNAVARSNGWSVSSKEKSVICPECLKSAEEWETENGRVEDPNVFFRVQGDEYDKGRV